MSAINQSGFMPEIDKYLLCKDNNPLTECRMPFNAVYVTCEGYLTACCSDMENMLIVGDLNKESVEDAWYGKKMVELRQRFLSEDYVGLICDNCLNGNCSNIRPFMEGYCAIKELSYSDDLVKNRVLKYIQHNIKNK